MAKAALTKRTVDAASPAAREYIVWDAGGKETVKGFGLRVSPSGGKTYIFQYRLAVPGQAAATTPRKYTIGKHGQLTPDQARTRAKELAFQVAQGIDPRESELERFAARERARADAERDLQEREAQSFRSLSAQWLEEYVLDHRSATVGQARVAMSKYLTPVLGDTVVRDIVKADVQRVIDRIPARRKATRQQVYAYASVFFKWALERDYTAENPLAGLSKPKGSKARDRVLSDAELALVLTASERVRTPFGPFFRLLIYTGQRREEVASMQWSDLDRQAGTWLIQADDAKNHRAHVVPLNALALHELDVLAGLAGTFKGEPAGRPTTTWPRSGPVLTTDGYRSIRGFSKAKIMLDAHVAALAGEGSPTEPWRVHDLRRTLATGLQRLGVRFEVTEAVLNHVSGARSGVAGIYQRYDWAREKREALEAWAGHLGTLTTAP